MAKKAYVVLKLKDEFSRPLKKAEKGTKEFDKTVELANKRIKKFSKAAMQDLTAFGTKTAKVLAGTATALAGVVLAKGWSRMTQIDNAKVKLEAIGNSAESVQKIMDNALASVKGTAYGMDAAATTAAAAVAAGIKPGKALEKYLSSVADAAAVAGIEMDEMGTIFNKVATRGTANNEVLTQLSERGIPIYQYLAKEIGTTAGKVFDMAKDGEISLETFQKAVRSNIGGAAKEMGSKTISGAISNVNAALSRIGANFIGSADNKNTFAGQLLPVINKLTESLGKAEDKAKEWGAVFGAKVSKAIEYVTKNIDSIIAKMKLLAKVALAFYAILVAYKVINTVIAAYKVFKGVLAAVKVAQASLNLTMLANPILLIATAVIAFIAILVTAYKKSEKFRKVVDGLWSAFKKFAGYIKDKVFAIIESLKAKFEKVSGAVKKVVDKIKGLFGIGDKTIDVNVNSNTTTTETNRTKGHHKALGTTYFAGGLTGFNEIGPEEAVLPSGTRIIPAEKAGQGFGGKSVTVNLTVQGNVIGNREYMEETGRYIAERVRIAMDNI